MILKDECRDCPFYQLNDMDEGFDFVRKYKRPYFHKCGGYLKKKNLFVFEFGPDGHDCMKFPDEHQKSLDNIISKLKTVDMKK